MLTYRPSGAECTLNAPLRSTFWYASSRSLVRQQHRVAEELVAQERAVVALAEKYADSATSYRAGV